MQKRNLWVRITTLLMLVCMLSACTSLLIGNRAQTMLLKAFLTPLIGFDPTEVKLLEQPMIKDRLQPLLGDKYEPTMKLLNTAQEIQRDGALFYIASKYAPTEVKDVVDKAGMVWNADTNQFAVMLIKDGVPDIISEQPSTGEIVKPLLPTELQSAYDQAQAAQAVLKGGVQQQLNNAAGGLLQGLTTPAQD